jgi:hypothetical protein
MVSWGGGSEGAPTQNKHTSSKERHSCCACGFLWRCVLSLHLQSWLLICAKRPLTSHTSNCPSPTPALRQQSGGTHQLRAVSSTKRWHTSTAGCVVNKAVAHINCGLCRRVLANSSAVYIQRKEDEWMEVPSEHKP